MSTLIPAPQMRGWWLEGQKTWPRAPSMFLQGLAYDSGCLMSREAMGSPYSSSPGGPRARGRTSVCLGSNLPPVPTCPLIPPSLSLEPSLTPIGTQNTWRSLVQPTTWQVANWSFIFRQSPEVPYGSGISERQ